MPEERRVRAQPEPERTVTLRWEEGTHAGLVVVCRAEDIPIGLYWDFNQEAPTLAEQIARNARFGREVLLSWNLNDAEDAPIPATSAGMNAIPRTLAWDIATRWFDAVTAVPVPLDEPSSGSSTSAAGRTKTVSRSRRRGGSS